MASTHSDTTQLKCSLLSYIYQIISESSGTYTKIQLVHKIYIGTHTHTHIYNTDKHIISINDTTPLVHPRPSLAKSERAEKWS